MDLLPLILRQIPYECLEISAIRAYLPHQRKCIKSLLIMQLSSATMELRCILQQNYRPTSSLTRGYTFINIYKRFYTVFGKPPINSGNPSRRKEMPGQAGHDGDNGRHQPLAKTVRESLAQ